MKSKFVLKACLTAGISILSVIPATIAHASNGVTDYIIEYQGQPAIAVFEDVKQSYALGCSGFSSLWSRVPVQRAVSPATFNRIVSANPIVADIPCNGSVDPYALSGEPGALVIRHRNGRYYRHYVDSIEFVRTVGGGDLIPISRQEFYKRFPNRGTDFRLSR
ncbi:hypothetical protein [Microseira wollei]|uniref:Uncharacterized protein n=1 Tax=Microseira wollei NIES-4236 TaxID=2530354 RepID=A0AAV3XQY6_9CYAN|nr:hypothetical protein [Microseira wollei]GET43244.1 hypothetical protein MiSe_80660 [Microseira wollei NIES-4236]